MADVAWRVSGWKPLALRWRVVLTVAAVVAAVFGLGAAFIYEEAREDRHGIAHEAVAAAVAGAGAFDRDVASTSYLAKGLSTSPALASGDLKGFYDQLVATAGPEGSWFILWDRERQVLNSRQPFGAVLPTRAEFGGSDEGWNRIRSRKVSIGDRTFSPLTKTFVLPVSLRLDGEDGEMKDFLSVVVPETHLNAVVRGDALPAGWVTTILDRRLTPVATSGDPVALGRELPQNVQARLRDKPGGGHFWSHDGVRDALIAYHRSPVSDFTALTSIPLAVANAPVRDARRTILGGGVIVLLAGALAGLVVARQVGPMERSAAATARQLRLAEARYASLWNDTPEGLFVVTVTPEGRFVFEGLNPVHERATGLSFASIAGKEPEECLAPETAAAVLQRYRHCVASGQPEIYDEVLDLPGGRRYWQTSLAPVRDPATGRIVLLVGTARDVTADREARAETERSQRLLQATLDALSARIAILDGAGAVVAVNRAWQDRGADPGARWPADAVGTDYIETLRIAASTDPEAGLIAAGIETLLAGRREEFRTNYPSGDRHFQVRAARFGYQGSTHVVVAYEDVTELASARRDVRNIAGRLLSLQEEERQRIAADLHDSTAQHIVAAGLGLMHVGAVAGDRRRVEEALAPVRSSLDEAQKEIRTLSYLLHPPNLQRNGLAASLRQFVEGFSQRMGLRGTIAVPANVDGLPLDLQRAILRVVQEALVNVHRHAEAGTVSVSVAMEAGALRLRVSDDGKGLRARGKAHDGGPVSLGVGIPGMEARIHHFGGTLAVTSSASGTTISATVPLEGAPEHGFPRQAGRIR